MIPENGRYLHHAAKMLATVPRYRERPFSEHSVRDERRADVQLIAEIEGFLRRSSA